MALVVRRCRPQTGMHGTTQSGPWSVGQVRLRRRCGRPIPVGDRGARLRHLRRPNFIGGMQTWSWGVKTSRVYGRA